MMGAEPKGLDATAFAFVAGVLCPLFDTPLRSAAERHDDPFDQEPEPVLDRCSEEVAL